MATETDLQRALDRAWILEGRLWAALRHARALVEECGSFHPHCAQCRAIDELFTEAKARAR